MSHTPIECVRVLSIHEHPKADRLEIVKILGTQVCSPAGDFNVGDLAVYFPPDMLIPEETAEKLGVKNYLKHAVYPGHLLKSQCRIGAVRLRQVPSVGFLLKFEKMNMREGDDLTNKFKGAKYNPPMQNMRSGLLASDTEYFPKYTAIQHYYRHVDCLPEGVPVRITEKIHGCVKTGTRVRMADGTSKFIQRIQPGEYVAGMVDGKIVPSKVLQVFQNGSSMDWLKIQFKRERCGRGNSFGSVTCTPNHQFFIDGSYSDASTLRLGDKLSVLRSDWRLSHIQEQILLGKMLGDGHLSAGIMSAHIAWGHVSKDLTDWTAMGLGDLHNKRGGDRQLSGYGSLMHRARTHNSVFILDKFESFIKDGRKIIPDWVIDKLTPLAIAFWYMDDGSLSHHSGQEDRAHFAVCGFTETDCQILIKALKKYCITAIYYRDPMGYSRLRLNADEAEKLFLLIVPYIPDSLQYKLPKRYRGHTGWLPSTEDSYKTDLVSQTITSITPIVQSSPRWDLETETHNYMPSNVVTHNSNSRVGLIGGLYWPDRRFMCGTHRTNRREFDQAGRRSLYWQPMTKPMEDMLETLYVLHANYMAFDSVTVYGEIFGTKVQAMDYGVEGAMGYRVFDIAVGGEFLDWKDVKRFCDYHKIPTVPLLYEGPFRAALVDELMNGPTTVCGEEEIRCSFKGREGIVVTPLEEQYDEELQDRLILKAVSPDYYSAMN